jgi:hypothetical protein
MTQPSRSLDEAASASPRADEIVKLAYEAATKYLAQQDTSLGNLRNRATWLITAAGILASLAANLGLLNTDSAKGPVPPFGFVIALLIAVGLIGLVVVLVVRPAKGWTFGPAARALLEEAGRDETTVRTEATRSLIASIAKNNREYEQRSAILSIGFGLLIVEILIILIGRLVA